MASLLYSILLLQLVVDCSEGKEEIGRTKHISAKSSRAGQTIVNFAQTYVHIGTLSLLLLFIYFDSVSEALRTASCNDCAASLQLKGILLFDYVTYEFVFAFDVYKENYSGFIKRFIYVTFNDAF